MHSVATIGAVPQEEAWSAASCSSICSSNHRIPPLWCSTITGMIPWQAWWALAYFMVLMHGHSCFGCVSPWVLQIAREVV